MPVTKVSRSPEVFISYSSGDRARVLIIADYLQSAGVRLWLDRRKIDGGMWWAEEIARGIKCCKVLMLMCSDAAMQSRAVKQEIQLAWKYGLVYLPLLLTPTQFPEQLQFFLEGCQWIDVVDSPPEQWLTPVLRALIQAGVECSGVGPVSLETKSSIQPTRPDPGLEGLRSVAKFTDRIWPLVVEEEMLHPQGKRYIVRDIGVPQKEVQHRIRLGSKIFWAINWDQEAHLLLIDEGPEGKTYCLCPSWFVPNTRIHPGITLLPPEAAGCGPFVLTGVPGRENLLAILTEQSLDLDWMPPDTRIPARILSEADIGQLLLLLQRLRADTWTALATYCDVVV